MDVSLPLPNGLLRPATRERSTVEVPQPAARDPRGLGGRGAADGGAGVARRARRSPTGSPAPATCRWQRR